MSGAQSRNNNIVPNKKIEGGIHMKKTISLVVLGLVLLTMITVTPVTARSVSWKEYDFISTAIIPYDTDKDGVIEILALPYYMIDNYVQVKSPYMQYEHGLLADVNLDGVKELVLYNDAGDYLIYNGTTLLEHFYLGTGSPTVDLTGEAIAVGNRVLFNMTIYTFPENTNVYPVVAGNRLYVLYEAGNKLYLEDTDGNKWTVYDDAIEPIGAVIYYDTLYMIGKAPLSGTVFIKYSIGGTAQISGFTTNLKRAVKWIPYNKVFIAEGEDGNIYRVSFYSLVLENTGTVLGCDDRYIYLYQNGEIVVYNPATKNTIYKIQLPKPAEPDVFGGSYPYIGVVYDRKTYIAVLKPEPIVYLVIPSEVTVGEPIYYKLHSYNSIDVSLSVNGTALPLEGYIMFNKTGTYVFTASASNGLITVTRTYKVRAKPRPLILSIKVLGSAIVYEKTNITVEALDGLNGSRIKNIFCTLYVSDNFTLTIKPWEQNAIPLIPVSEEVPNIPIIVRCGDGEFYAETVYSINIPAQPNNARIKIDYLGNGKVQILFTSPVCSQCIVPGEVNVYLDNEFVSHGSIPYILSGLTPGNHTIVVEFTPRLPVYKPARYIVKLTYYGNITEVPEEILKSVQIADRVKVKVVNNTVVKTKTVTVPKPIYIEKKVPDTQMTLFLFVVGLVAGATAGFVTRYILYERRGTGKREEKPSIEKELEDYEVEIEKT